MDREKGKERTVKVTVNTRHNTKGEQVGKMMKGKYIMDCMEYHHVDCLILCT